jgi:hypothetical protein
MVRRRRRGRAQAAPRRPRPRPERAESHGPGRAKRKSRSGPGAAHGTRWLAANSATLGARSVVESEAAAALRHAGYTSDAGKTLRRTRPPAWRSARSRAGLAVSGRSCRHLHRYDRSHPENGLCERPLSTRPCRVAEMVGAGRADGVFSRQPPHLEECAAAVARQNSW